MDIYGIISRRQYLLKSMTIPNSRQYKGIKYFEKRVESANYYLTLRNREDKESIYEDQRILVMLLGNVCSGQDEVSVHEFSRMYLVEGNSIFERLKGTFNVVIIEKPLLRVMLVSDHFGIIPIFHYYDNEKVVFSTKLDFVKLNAGDNGNTLDYMAILEQVHFNYVLGEKTYYKNIYMQNAGSILEFTFDGVRITKREKIYWHISQFLDGVELPYHRALKRYTTEFYDIVNAAANNSRSLALAFTAGYDTRANLAVLQDKLRGIPCFSYGIRGSPDIDIPLSVREKLGINYFPLYLEGPFEENFVDIASNAIFHSDGLGDLEKSNNEYAYRHLSLRYSDVVVGIFGSEFLKCHFFPNRLVDRNILAYFNTSEDYRPTFNMGFVNEDLLRDFSKSISAYLAETYLRKYPKLPNSCRLLLYYYYEGVRKYFMKELRISRYYVNVIMPYLDKQLLEIVFKSELSHALYNKQLEPHLLQRSRTHFVYSYIIKRYMPALLEVNTDRGYKPKYDLSFYSRFFIIPSYVKNRSNTRRNSYLYDIWAKPFIDKYVSILHTSDLIRPLLPNNQTTIAIDDKCSLRRLLSVASYLNGMFN